MSNISLVHKAYTTTCSMLICLLLFPVMSQGMESENNGRKILQACQAAVEYLDNDRASGKDQEVQFCNDYLTGYREYENAKEIYLGEMTGQKLVRGYCLPTKGITNAELARVVVHYLEDNTQTQSLDASTAIFHALVDGYPCN